VKPPPQIFVDLREKPLLLGVLLALAAVLLYSPAAHHPFLAYDDSLYVTQNVHVSTGLSFTNLKWAFTNFSSFWHPVTWISHMTDCQTFGLNPCAHHLVNVLLHAVNVLLLFLLLQKSTGAVWRSFVVAGLFAVHPANVETVAWIAERKSLLSALFSLLTIAAYARYVQRPSWRRYLVVALTFSLALMSKSMAVTLPVILLLLDYWPLRRWDRGSRLLLLEKVPLLVLSALSSVATVLSQRGWGALVAASDLPLYLRLENAFIAYVAYLRELIWPANLAIFYPHPALKVPEGGHLPWQEVLASFLLLTAITLAVVKFRHIRYLVVGWLGFLIALFPVSGVVQVGLAGRADRYAYLPYIFLFIMVVWSAGDLIQSLPAAKLTIPAAAVSACVLTVFAYSATQYLAYWEDGAKLLEHARAVAGAPDIMIEALLGDAYYYSGRPAAAAPHYQEWCELAATNDLCHYRLAQALFQLGRLQPALQQYQLAASLTRDQGMASACARKSQEILRLMEQH